MSDLKAASDTRDEETLDGFDTRDTAPEPGDEDHATKQPKRKRRPRARPVPKL